MDRPTSETPSEERTEIEPSQADPVDLGKTLSSINDNLQGMSKLLLHARKSCLMSICKLGGGRVPPSHTVKSSRISQTSKNFPFSKRIKTI